MSVYKKFLGQTMVYGISTIASRLLNFILTPIFTRSYGAAALGVFTKMYAYASMTNAILAFGMETTFFRYLNKYENKKDQVYNNSFLIVAFISVLFLITGLVFTEPITKWLLNNHMSHYQDQKRYVQYFLWLLFSDAICVIPFARIRADGKPFRYSIIKFVNILSYVLLSLFFIYGIPLIIKHDLPGHEFFQSWFRDKWVGYVFISNLIASAITFLLLVPEFLKVQFKFDGVLFKNMLSYSWPVLVANLSFIVNENLDKILLDRYTTEAQVGIYGAVCKLAIFLSIFNMAFRLGAEPFFFSYAKNENAKVTYAKILEYFVIALSILFVALTANIEILKYFISRDKAHLAEYWVGLPAVPYLLVGYVCLGIYMNLSIWYRLSDQTRFGLYISLVGATITIVFNVILIPKYSYMGSAWVSMATYGTMMIISYILGQKYYPIPYNLKKILAYLIVSTIIVFSSFFIFNKNIYIGNAMLIAFVCGVAYFEKNDLMKILKR
ncbi:O-antigen/teichoic acid export membrane protein [Pedobacter psychrotolerans]|uniref:O-antigen/teichoic acid export membrane protein n=2 Tax=Pedobacter psychrotolerans TaxID=1843235 RepID=A0A4R2H9Z0_9SPHI|nr:oligosaccharide flippase family protein [Pedobacter psychrotolerans]TCO23937.1 O-antigen/teichoic acid export membrane protein [Pedobacter psychrotolerans]